MSRRPKLEPEDLDKVLIDFEFGRQFALTDVPVSDLGDVFLAPGESSARGGERLAVALDLVLRSKNRPLVLGGDQSVSRFLIRSVAEHHARIGILHFDAHHDLYDVAYGEHHGNAFRGALSDPRVDVIRQIGLRVFEIARPGAHPEPAAKVSYVSARDANRRSPEEVFAGLPTDIPYLVSFDVDCLSPEVSPETGTPEIGGIGYDRCMDLLQHVSSRFQLVAADIVEVRREGRQVNWAARAAAQVLMRIVLGVAASTPVGPSYATASWR